jgi:hypothetical protein
VTALHQHSYALTAEGGVYTWGIPPHEVRDHGDGICR